jgi:hypothetical protein
MWKNRRRAGAEAGHKVKGGDIEETETVEVGGDTSIDEKQN